MAPAKSKHRKADIMAGKSLNDKYKIKSVQTYAWDRVMNQRKKFRRVFDQSEINYLSVALEFYNKLFDEEDWRTEITFQAHTLDGDKKTHQHCSDKKKYTITKDQNIVTLDFGWGNAQYGQYWKKGSYIWEVYMDNELVGSAKFHIEDAGRVGPGENPYFEVKSLKTYEAPEGDLPEAERVYLKGFPKEETRYIMSELKFINNVADEWLCELLFRYYDDTGTLVGVSDSLGYITPELGPGESFTISAGWGSAAGNSWIHDNYRVEVVFMDQVVAMIPFAVGDEKVERLSDYEALINADVSAFYGHRGLPHNSRPSVADNNDEVEVDEDTDNSAGAEEEVSIEINDRPLNEILEELDMLVGLKDIKKKVREYVDYVCYLQYRREKGLKDDESIHLHSVFTGNPGTGKTTVVKLLGQIYHSMGLLSKGHVHAVESSDLISGYVRQTGKDTKEAIEKARGGILFIDEAYMLFKDHTSNDFGPEAVAALIVEMSDGPGDIAIMVAGYPVEMERFLDSNPGLKSRFRNYYHFEDYTPAELVEIAGFAARKKEVVLSDQAIVKMKKILTDAYRRRDRSFGNARLAHSLVDEAKMNLGIRLVRNYDPEKLTRELLTTIGGEDVVDTTACRTEERLDLDVDKALLDQAMAELNELTGLHSIKQEMQELVRLTRYYREMDRDVLRAFSMHSVFMGNPGTGKTTVARIIGKVFKALGMLERGHLVEADASDLIAGFIGQSALKTKELVKNAMGGILFIDEAYAITEGQGGRGGDDFGKKAVAALIKEMEDHRGEFAVIVAGYPDNMEEFIKSNPGIKSRFDRTFHFEDFSEEELWLIAVNMFAAKGVKADQEAAAHLKAYIAHLYANRNKFFGNARSIRKLVEKSFRNHELRMADLSREERTEKVISALTLKDVAEFVPGGEKTEKKGIGYKFG